MVSINQSSPSAINCPNLTDLYTHQTRTNTGQGQTVHWSEAIDLRQNKCDILRVGIIPM